MSNRYNRRHLRRLRNEVPLPKVFRILDWPHKKRDGYVRFLCPHCQEFNTAVNPRTNLGRCFRCERNFNPIDFVIEVRGDDFADAVTCLSAMLPRSPRSEA
jgi:DNA primase